MIDKLEYLIIVVGAESAVSRNASRVDVSFDATIATGRFSFCRSSANNGDRSIRETRYDNGTF